MPKDSVLGGSATEIKAIMAENDRRNAAIRAKFNPITGKGSIGERVKIEIRDFNLPIQYIPKRMMQVPLVRQIVEAGSIEKWYKTVSRASSFCDEEKHKVVEQLVRIRCRHDFAFWAALYVFIKNKGGGEDVHFRLNRPQRKLITRFEKMRLAGKPIRLILLKARQWGGSTATQIYMAWLQLMHKVGLNSLIVGHVKDASNEVKDMFDRMIKAYPIDMLYKLGECPVLGDSVAKESKLVGDGNSGNIHRIPLRNCKIKIGTAESLTQHVAAIITWYIFPKWDYGRLPKRKRRKISYARHVLECSINHIRSSYMNLRQTGSETSSIGNTSQQNG